MGNMVNQMFMTIYSPANVFRKIIDKPSIREAIVIIIVLFSTAIIRPIADIYTQYMHQPIVSYIFMILIIIFLYLFSAMVLIAEALYIKLVLYIIGMKEKLAKIVTLLAYTMIPSIIGNIIVIIYPKLLVTTTVNGKIKILYSKLSVGYFINNSSNQYPIIYNLIKSVSLFTIWSNLLEILALSILCKLTYSKAIMILIPYWLLSALIPMFFL